MMANRPRGVLYVGVTADLAARVFAHREGRGSDFCAKWRIGTLVWAERLPSMGEAIAHEKRVKRWARAWKIALVERGNPDWGDVLGFFGDEAGG